MIRRLTIGPAVRGGALCAVLVGLAACGATEEVTVVDRTESSSEEAPRPMGLVVRTDDVAPGYVLFSPLSSGMTYLLDTEAKVVHSWDSDYSPHSLYLLENGDLLRPGRDPDAVGFQAGGAMGLVELFNWEGDRLWHWKLSDDRQILHHDIEPLPNGNFLAIGWELITPEEALAVGRRGDLLPEEGLWADFIVEVEPLPPDDARIVWKWRIMDHLVQDIDESLPNYGVPASHPHRLDINGGGPPLQIDADQLAELQALGYVPTPAEDEAAKQAAEADDEETDLSPDWLHVNAVDWHPTLDQMAVTAPELGEVWILNRPSSTAEAAGEAGDLLYRWGNPSIYGRGPTESKRLFYPHDVQWIPEGYEYAGEMTVFNNGSGRPQGEWTSIEQFRPPLRDDGTYELAVGQPYGPADLTWHYRAEDPESFFAPFISGAHRLPNGNTFVTSGPEGRLFEIDLAGKTVWEFWNPWGGDVRKRNTNGPRGDSFNRRLAYGIWRAQKYSPDFPALAGRMLAPLSAQPEPFELPAPPPEDETGDDAQSE